MTLALTHAKLKQLRKAVRQAQSRAALSPRDLSGLIGQLQATHNACDPASLWLRSLHRDLHQAVRSLGWSKKHRWALSQESLDDLARWSDLLRGWPGKALIAPDPDWIVTTDASHTGWGGWLSLPSAPESPVATAWGFWSRAEAKRHSNWREATATLLVMRSFSSLLQHRSVLARTDNSANMANINKGGGPSEELTSVVHRIWDLCSDRSIALRATYRPGQQNQLADTLSRVHRDNSDWMLHPLLFRALEARWGPFSVDLFATRLNRQLPVYYSLQHDPEATAVDAFRQDWSQGRPYGNPPFAIIGAVLAKVERDLATVTLVVPEWRSAAWWPMLLRLLADVPVRVPLQHDTFLPGHMGNEVPVGLPPWGVLACRVSGSPDTQLAFRLQLCARPLSPAVRRQVVLETRRGDAMSAFATALEATPWPSLL